MCQLSVDLLMAHTQIPMCSGLVRLHTHIVTTYALCLMGSGCAGPLLWPTFKSISVQETAVRNMGSLLIHIFFCCGEHNAISFKSSITKGNLLPLWRTGDCSVCIHPCVFISDCFFSGTEVSLPCLCTITQCKNPSSLRSASSVVKTVRNKKPFIFCFLKAHFKMEENCNFQDRLI